MKNYHEHNLIFVIKGLQQLIRALSLIYTKEVGEYVEVRLLIIRRSSFVGAPSLRWTISHLLRGVID